MTENTSSTARGNVNGRYQSGNIFSADYTASQDLRAMALRSDRLRHSADAMIRPGDGRCATPPFSKVGIGPLIQSNAS